MIHFLNAFSFINKMNIEVRIHPDFHFPLKSTNGKIQIGNVTYQCGTVRNHRCYFFYYQYIIPCSNATVDGVEYYTNIIERGSLSGCIMTPTLYALCWLANAGFYRYEETMLDDLQEEEMDMRQSSYFIKGDNKTNR